MMSMIVRWRSSLRFRGRYLSTSSSSSSSDSEKRRRRQHREAPVPEDPLSRMLGIASVGVNIALNVAQQAAKQALDNSNNKDNTSLLFSTQNTELLASELCRLRGAALKVGQILSLQDEHSIPEPLQKVLKQVRTHANVMPKDQLEKCLKRNLGADWKDKFKYFETEPMAAASIGQVHRALISTNEGDEEDVCVKVQYPGVARSIVADMRSLERLLVFSGMIPKGLFLDRVLKTARQELSAECDYIEEAKHQRSFRDLILQDSNNFRGVCVPKIVDELSTKEVLTMEWVRGVPIDETVSLSQDVRNSIASRLLRLTVNELFVWHRVQSDPNWSNFLYDEENDELNLLDFGASRTYPDAFMRDYLGLVWACANADRDAILSWSRKLGFLCGRESRAMTEAHISMALVMGEPFLKNEPYDFERSNYQTRLAEHASTFTRERLMPPPTEVYTLHRKLFGTINACVKIGARIPCRHELENVFVSSYDGGCSSGS
jgi:aarF domain-containing kinase